MPGSVLFIDCALSCLTVPQFGPTFSYSLIKLLCLYLHSPLHVVLFGAVTGALGVSVLLTQVNGLTAALG